MNPKLIGYLVALAAIVGVAIVVNGWRVKARTYETEKVTWNAERANLKGLLATAEDDRQKADDRAKSLEAANAQLEKDHHDNPLPPVRLCRSPAAAARVPETGSAATVTHAAIEANDAGQDAADRDIGPALDDFATDAEMNLNQCAELQRWVQERTH